MKRHTNAFSNMDGEISEFEITTGLSASKPSLLEDLPNEFESPVDEYFNMAIGEGTILDKNERARRRALREANKQKKQESRQSARDKRAQAKLTQAEAGKVASESLNNDNSADLAKAIAGDPTQATTTEPKSNMKYYLIGGGVLVLGVIIFMVANKHKNNG